MMFFPTLGLTVLSMLQQSTAVAPRDWQCAKEPIAAAWYMQSDKMPLQQLNWSDYNTIYYSFALTTQDVHNLSLSGSDLPQFVDQAHKNNVAAHLAIGGWTGSRFFSSHVATPHNRTAFVQTVIDLAEQYDLDGISFDWEYPAQQGIGCNAINANDTENFLAFLQELRAHPGCSDLTLSAATSITPFHDASGNSSKNVSGFANLLDHIIFMNYDVWGSWSTGVGPNAPLNDTCAAPANQAGSAVSAVEAWTAAGISANQIVLGVASYGHSFSVSSRDAFVSGSNTLAAYPKFNSSNQPMGDSQSSAGGIDVCGVKEGPGGTFNFWGLVDAGFLDENGNPAPGIFYRYDDCSQTPYVYNKTSEIMISFDNTKSFAAKGHFIQEMGLRGFSMWQAGGDYHGMLIDSIKSAAGIDDVKTHKRGWNWN